jgi:hypothetical protein
MVFNLNNLNSGFTGSHRSQPIAVNCVAIDAIHQLSRWPKTRQRTSLTCLGPSLFVPGPTFGPAAVVCDGGGLVVAVLAAAAANVTVPCGIVVVGVSALPCA